MLEEIIKELTTVKSDKQTTSGNVIVRVKRVEAQWAQATVMSVITKCKEFDKMKVSRQIWTESQRRTAQHNTPLQPARRYCGSTNPPRQCLAYGKTCKDCSKVSHFRRVCRSQKTRAVNEIKQEITQDNTGGDIEMVSINSVHFNKNCSILTANLKTSVGKNSISVPYKIDMGSDRNIMPLHIFKKLFPGVTNEQIADTINKCILLKKYNKMTITQLGTCKLMIEHKNNRKKCQFFVVPSKWSGVIGYARHRCTSNN